MLMLQIDRSKWTRIRSAVSPVASWFISVAVSVLLGCGGGKGKPAADAGIPIVVTDGSVKVTPHFAECADLVVTASPQWVRVGGKVDVAAVASGGPANARLTYHWSATAGSFADASLSATTYTCPGADRAGPTMVTCTVSDGTCAVTRTVRISCLGVEISDASSGGDADAGSQTDGSKGDGATDTSPVDSSQSGSGGSMGTQTCLGDPSTCEGELCNQCTFGVPEGQPDLCSATASNCSGAGMGGNCYVGTDSCAGLMSDSDRTKCWALYVCLRDSKCIKLGTGDAIPCWCGSKTDTCMTDNSPPGQADGPCVTQVFAAAKSTNAAFIYQNLSNPDLPIGRAFNLAGCRSLNCGKAASRDAPACPLW